MSVKYYKNGELIDIAYLNLLSNSFVFNNVENLWTGNRNEYDQLDDETKEDDTKLFIITEDDKVKQILVGENEVWEKEIEMEYIGGMYYQNSNTIGTNTAITQDFELDDTITIETHFMYYGMSQSGGRVWHMVDGSRIALTTEGYLQYKLYGTGNTTAGWINSAWSDYFDTPRIQLSKNEYYTIATVINHDFIKIYVNGELAAETNIMPAEEYRYRSQTYTQLNLLFGNDATTARTIGGTMKNFRIYNRELTANEVSHNYQVDLYNFSG